MNATTSNVTAGVPLPPVAAGQNPFEVYTAYLDRAFVDVPGSGFTVRVAILLVLLGLIILMRLIGIVCVVLQRRKAPHLARIWVWKFVERPGGRYLVTNYNSIQMLLSPFVACVLAAYTIVEYRKFIYHTDQRYSAFDRSVVWLPLVVNVYVSAFSSLQAHLLLAEARNHKVPRWVAPVANWGYLVLAVLMFGPMITMIILASVRWYPVWDGYLILRSHLVADSAAFGTIDTNAITSELGLVEYYYTGLISAAEAHDFSETGYKSIILLAALITLLESGFAPTAVDLEKRRELEDASRKAFAASVALLVGGVGQAGFWAWSLTVPSLGYNEYGTEWAVVELSLFFPVWIYAPFTVIYGIPSNGVVPSGFSHGQQSQSGERHETTVQLGLGPSTATGTLVESSHEKEGGGDRSEVEIGGI
ncbi:hypothetical protein MNV49_004041 [Pseudohyphozyma bogoriensis]|nr:hypothetical protein MNV49_004041 [Pseudohyphozyma bogoriensis]